MTEETSEKIFEECSICILPSKDLSANAAQLLAEMIRESDGQVVETNADGTIDLDSVTHIVSETIDFRQYTQARDRMIHVVKPSWIKESNRKNKLAQVKPHTPDPRLFFSGVTFAIGNIPDLDATSIIGVTMFNGGQYSPGLTKMVTHIVALTMDDEKCRQALAKKIKCKIVLPHWFDDCFKIGAKIDEKPYLLPDPEIGRELPDAPVDFPDTSQLQGALLPSPTREPVVSYNRKLNVFKDRKVMLSQDLEISKRLRGIVENLIKFSGGALVDSVFETDIYICPWRDGRDYLIASCTEKEVGNLAWLYFLITHNEWTSPFKRLLHYPLPRGGIPGFKDLKITISNYGGEARTYLENLVMAAGGTFTKSMKQDNTHLITARKNSEKCDAALDWNIAMVNHLWMEQSYAKCEIQALTQPKYTHYPPRTNLGEVIGQTQFDKNILQKKYYSKLPDLSPAELNLVRAMKGKDTNSHSSKKTPAPKKTYSRKSLPKSDGLDSPMDNSALSRKQSALFTPAANRLTDKENETPSTTGSRSAKDKALTRLHDLAPDIALYEKEKKRHSGIWGGKQAAERSEKEYEAERKRTSTSELVSDDGSGAEREAKRRKANILPEITIRLLLTSYPRWLVGSEHAHKMVAEQKKLRNLGILIVQDPSSCTHMAAPHLVRTPKFLTALAFAPVIVSTDFVDACIEKKKIPKVDDYLLDDKKNEAARGINLQESLARAKANGHTLLRGVAVFCTNKITNGPGTYRRIVEVNGGTFAEFSGRHAPLRKPSADTQAQEEREPLYLLSSTKEEERKLWPKFKEMARVGGMDPRIVSTDWLLTSTLAQQLEWDEKYLIAEAQ